MQRTLFCIALAAASVHAAPLTKRIAQVISDSTTKWEAACTAAGGGSQCNTISVSAFGNLLVAADACGQQNAADSMIDLAKQLNNNAAMIQFAQIFAQQPRNSPDSFSIPYCQSAPKNAELNGLFQCQFQGTNPSQFQGGLAAGAPGTIPFGLSASVNPAGSCPAHTSGPITAGAQLFTITTDPGVAGASSGSNQSSSNSSGSSASSADSGAQATAVVSSSSPAASAPAPAAPSAAASSSSSGFQLQNGQAAQALNKQFASLTTSSSCTAGQQACVAGAFAQCIGGSWVATQCAASETCVALPLVNKAGTSITCDTQADAEARIAATGATGGLTGDGASSGTSTTSSSSNDSSSGPAAAAPASNSAAASPSPSAAASSGSSDFHLQNGQAAQALNKQFASLTTSSSCDEGQQACVGGAFAQCVGGSWETTQCAATETCLALPLVNKAGTSITCDTQADAEARIAATGATGGLTGGN